MTEKPTYEELEGRIRELEAELLEKKKSEDTLWHSELRLKAVFHSLEEAVFVVTSERNIVQFNEAAQKIFGYSENELIGLSTEVLHVDHEHYVRFGEMIKGAFRSGGTTTFEFTARRKNGEVFPSRHIVSQLKDDSGNPIGILSVLKDLTRQVLVEKDLKQKRKDLERAQRVAHIGSWTYDPKTQLPTWSDEMFHIFGMAPGAEAPCYEEHRRLIHPEDWDRFDAAVQKAVTEGIGYNLEIRVIRPDGEVRYVHAICEAAERREGEGMHLVGTTQDIHQRRIMEEALRESEKKYKKAERMGNFGHWTRDLTANKAYWSPQMYKIFGVDPEHFKPLWINFLDRVHPGDRERLREEVARATEKRGGVETEYRVVRPDGGVRHVRSSAETTIGPDKKTMLAFGILFDITEEKHLRMELDRHLLQLFRANRLASLGEMVAGVAHEINNPNSLITFNLPLMEDIWGFFKGVINEYAKKHPDAGMGKIPIDELTQDMDDILGSMKRGSTRINQVVGKLKTFALPDEAQEPQRIELNKVVEETMTIFSAKLKKHADKIHYDLSESLPPVWGYPLKMEQVLGNLLVNAANAISQKENGRISITTRHVKDLGAVLLEVADTGTGMTRDQMEKIFDPFFTTRRKDGGTGLGLSISHGLVKEHHGVIAVLSRPEMGSRFTVFLPVEKGGRQGLQPNLLIIDDDVSVLKVLNSRYLKLDKHFVQTLSQPESVLKYLEGHPEIDLVLSDVVMPGMDGWQLLREIRRDFPLLPVILYSGSQEALENPFHDIQPDFLIQKPFDRNHLIECINQVSRLKL